MAINSLNHMINSYLLFFFPSLNQSLLIPIYIVYIKLKAYQRFLKMRYGVKKALICAKTPFYT